MTPALFRNFRGRILEQAPLARRTTWRIGGAARYLAFPENGEDLAMLLGLEDLPRLLLGGGSNLLICDQGLDGIAVDLSEGWKNIALDEEEGVITAGAGATTRAVAHFARLHGLAGAEFLSGIPGRIGGAVAMNAGAYGREMKDTLLAVETMDPSGTTRILPAARLNMGYRFSNLPKDWVVLAARMRLQPDSPEAIRLRMRGLNQKRRESQPIGFPSAGSTFKNPPSGPKAWEWIARAGCRGMRVGDAQVSEKHCNFFVNLGRATARDMHCLIDSVQNSIARIHGPELELEVRVVGEKG